MSICRSSLQEMKAKEEHVMTELDVSDASARVDFFNAVGFPGMRTVRFAERLLFSGIPRELRAQIREAEKFFVSAESLDFSDEGMALRRFPYRNLWIEVDDKADWPTGFLIAAEENCLAADVRSFIEPPDLGNKNSGIKMVSFFVQIREDEIFVQSHDPREVVEICRDQLLYLLSLINQPHAVIDLEDYTQYNKARRRLGQHKKQRLAFHTVRLSQELEREVYHRLNAEPNAHSTRGEHTVRGFYRYYKSGRVSWVRPHRRGSGECKSKRLGYEIA